MDIKNIDLSYIDFEDRSFYIPFNNVSTEIISSIKKVGVINPPLLLSKNSKYIVVTGWKRIAACMELGIKELTCKILNQDYLDVKKIIIMIYEDNKCRLTDVEIGLLAGLYSKYNHNINDFLKLIGIATSDKNLEKFEFLSNVNDRIIELYLDDKLNSDQVFMLSSMEFPLNILVTEKIIIPFRFNANETRDFIKDVSDVSKRDRKSIESVIDYLLDSGEKISKDKIRYNLKKIRYPGLSEVEDQFSNFIKYLKLPRNINISHSPYFENNYIDIFIKVSGNQDLSAIKSLFETDDKYELLTDLANLVRKGLH